MTLARAPPMWKLVIEDDEGKRTVVPLSREDYTIGRQEGNTIRLTERNVSRSHGRIRRNAASNGASKEAFVLDDCESYNGVFVNGLRVAETQELQHGDLVQIGDYRLVIQDDAASAVEAAAIPVTTTDPGDAKVTMQMAASFRGQAMTERPHRLVMLVGPTPGVEFPLELERMTIGRAEDSNISVNHNSVSRLHCEVHALGDGRFEIVDKGSSNGVRVNSVDLRRSIIEAGDVIELGDVRFKFVGAGQVFVPGPNESQQLTAISDREAELVDRKARGWTGYTVPILAAGVVGAGIILGFVYLLRARTVSDQVTAPRADADEVVVREAKAACSTDDCEASFQRVLSLRPDSPWRASAEYQQIVATWADSLLKRAQGEGDPAMRKILLLRVASDPNVDAARKKAAADQLAIPEDAPTTPNQLPVVAATRDAGTTVTSALVNPPVPTGTGAATGTPRPLHPFPPPSAPPPTVTTASTVAPPATTVKPVSADLSDRAGKLLLDGRYAEAKALLDGKVRSGHASEMETRQYRQACKQLGDPTCSK